MLQAGKCIKHVGTFFLPFLCLFCLPYPFKLTRDFLGIRKAALSLYAVLIVSLRGGRNRIRRREKWPKQSWEKGEIGGKCREEGEKET